jgi:protein gp37
VADGSSIEWPKAGGRVLDGQTYDEMPERLAISA